MKCPECGQPSEVTLVRSFRGTMTRRSRKCLQGHRFTSFEVLAADLVVTPAPRVPVVTDEARAYVLANLSKPIIAVATHLGLSAQTVSKIRSNHVQQPLRKSP